MSLHKSFSLPKVPAPGSLPPITLPQINVTPAIQQLRENFSNLTSTIPGTGTIQSPLNVAEARAVASASLTNLASVDTLSAQLQTTGVFSSGNSQKIAEAAGAMVGKFQNGPATFQKMAANVPTFSQLNSLAQAAASKGTSLAIPAISGTVAAIGGALGSAALAGQSFVANNIESLRSFATNIAANASGAVSGLVDKGKNLVNNIKAGLAAAGFKGFAPAGVANKDLIQTATSSLAPDATASDINRTMNANGMDAGVNEEHIVKLTNKITSEVIKFMVLPEIVENRTVTYDAVAPVQFIGAFQKYKGTESVQWTLNSTFIARTSDEATTNLRYINWLRGWTMPFYGENVNRGARFKNRLGAPPPVLYLEGLRKSMIGRVPVVITSLQWNWPRDVDYIPAVSPDGTDNRIPFPTVIQVAIQLVESFSTDEFNRFDIEQYLLGNMVAAYGTSTESRRMTSGGTGAPLTVIAERVTGVAAAAVPGRPRGGT